MLWASVEACRVVHESKAPLLLLARASWYVIEGLSLAEEAILTESVSRHVAKRFAKAQNPQWEAPLEMRTPFSKDEVEFFRL
jgi:hypothetical protein